MLIGYNKTTNRIRVQIGNLYREYTIGTTGGHENGYNAEGDNTFRLVYNGGAAMTFYINGKEAYLTNGLNNAICLRFGMDGDDSSNVGSTKAWHGFAGGDEAQGNERTLCISSFGDGITDQE